jgi:peptidoglycan/xylan/chitin deacetylase (PgdA/CDA1 family)
MIITFDDGWKENYKLLPLIREYRFRPTIFLTSHLINTERHFWWTECDPNDIARLKNLPEEQRLNELRRINQYDQEKEYPGGRQALNLKELQEMKEFVDFGLHSCYHPVLTKCVASKKCSEIIECKQAIEQVLGQQVFAFAYPNGDYDEECIRILKENGLKLARTTDAGWNDIFSDPYRLKVTGVSDSSGMNKLISELTGIPRFLQYLVFKGSLNGQKIKKFNNL